jgi:diguanylate cyclase (GGDEF)-like protein/PAS domain S-box-containing protein
MIEPSAILRCKILVVDDQPANVTLLTMMLDNAGYQFVTSTMDPGAVCALHLKNQYDLILLDLLMPGMDGFQVMYGLKALEHGTVPSILVVTAQPGHKMRAMQAGAKDFISKPFDNTEMLIRIHYMLQVRLLDETAAAHTRQLEQTVLDRTADVRRSAEMFRELAANIPEALLIRNMDRQTIEYVNPAWHNLNGIRALPGDPLSLAHQAIHPDDLKRIGNERRKSGGVQSANEYRLVRPDGSVRWVQARTFPIASPSGKGAWAVEIVEDVTQRREAQHQLVHLARHDALTGLPNRTLFYESLRESLAVAERDHLTISVLLLDIDYFKAVNDTLGHAAGDALLCEFAATVKKCLRPEDITGRLGGDEFAVIVATPSGTVGAPFVAARIRKALNPAVSLDGQQITVTASIGIASYPADAGDVEKLLRCADTALYDAKAAGRNTFRCFTPELSARALKRMDIESALRAAHDKGEFVLYYQPKIQTESGKLTSVEALLRWNRPGHGVVMPSDFIPTLEEMGLIVPVGTWVIETACRQIRAWESAGLGRMRVAVNVSSRQIREEQFVSRVAEIVRINHIDSALLELEITESTFMAHGEPTDNALRKLKDIGISISIDDFGTGYSNLAYLKRFQVDALKIDIAFIRDVATNADAATIAVAIINMAHSLRLKVIAEGVETLEQLEFLRQHGCDEVQGYYLSKPLPAVELTARFRQMTAANAAQCLLPPPQLRIAAHG